MDLPGDSIPDSLELTSLLNQVFNVCRNLELVMKWRVSDHDRKYHYLLVDFPAGKTTHQVFVAESNAQELLDTDLSQIEFLSDFDAYIDRSSGVIECSVTPGYYRDLSELPGAAKIDPSIPTKPGDYRNERNWKYEVSQGSITLELTQPTKRTEAFLNHAFGILRVSGIDSGDYDGMLEQLETLSSSFFFDLDVNFDFPQALLRRRSFLSVPRAVTATSSLPFPTNAYPSEPISLYSYGRTSFGMPLVEFLAYYQCIEFFLPAYANREAVARLRMQIADPRFRLSEDESLIRAISAVAPLSSRRTTERDLLRLVLRGVTTEESIREFVESNSALTEHFCTKNQALSGVQRILLASGSADLRDQVADRVYQIRCRIVHTKFDGGEGGIDLLLPTSREVRSLTPDLTMIRSLARQTLIANALPLR